jgi:hypothetical protein
VSYSYQPKDPKAKLREVVSKYVSAMRVTGRVPNCSVFFGGSAAEASAPHTHGFLVLDRRPEACGARYLFLEDGDVLHAPGESWLEETNDELVTLLARSLADARMGGSGWLADGDEPRKPEESQEARDAREVVEKVPDRRSATRPHQGPERRS